MKHLKTTRRMAALVAITLLLAQSGHGARALPSTAPGVSVQSAAGDETGSTSYDLSWWTVDGGGGANSGGSYTLAGAIGQADAGPTLSGGNYALVGGFWQREESPEPAPENFIYLPLVLRNSS